MSVVESRDLFYQEGNSDKEYHIQLISNGNDFQIDCQWGRRGNTLQTQTKLSGATLQNAKKLYDKVVGEKVAKGYQDLNTGVAYSLPVPPVAVAVESVSVVEKRKIRWKDEEVLVPQLLNPIDESEVEKYLRDDAWGMQEKKDGKHQMIRFKSSVKVSNKKGKEVGFPSAWKDSLNVPCVLDGEAIGEIFYAFDLLESLDDDHRNKGYGVRWDMLKDMSFGASIKILPLAIGYKAKKALYDELVAKEKEGVVFKRLDAVHKPGRPNAGGDMVKFKFVCTASVKVVKGREGKHSIGMKILNGDKWEFIGNCTIPPSKEVPLSGVAEIRYLYAYKGGSLYQPCYLGLRDDVDENECVIGQLKYKSEEE
jgi:bifunctional non-homologous end joining protein LigD